MAEQEVEKTIKLYESLVKDFPTPESWAINILTASKNLTSGIAQTNFYRYLFAPNQYSFQKNIKLISQDEEEKYNRLAAEFDANNPHEVKRFRNGNDVNIVYLPNKKTNAREETKSMDSLSTEIQISTEEQIPEHETSDETGSCAVQEEEQKIDD